jgi:REP element-mobilizing transposase RayT
MTPGHHQNPATWECKDHVVFIPKYRKKAIFGIHDIPKVAESFKTAFSGSLSYHQLSRG